MIQEMGLRAAAREQVRSALLAAADELCAHACYENVTTQEIADRAGVSQRTFFRYFAAKEDVLLHFLDEHNRQICNIIRAQPAQASDVEILRRGFQVYCDLAPDEVRRTRAVTDLASSSTSFRKALASRQALWEDRIREALVEHRADAGRDELRMRHLVAMSMAILSVAFRESNESSARTFNEAIDAGFCLLGVRPVNVSED
jgi:AcrR family transcriptional regulator